MMVSFDVEASLATGAIVARHPAPSAVLLVVCGAEDAVEHEIWGRCHGAFCDGREDPLPSSLATRCL